MLLADALQALLYAAKVAASLAHPSRARSEVVATGAEKSGGSVILDRGKVKSGEAQMASAPVSDGP